MSTTATLELIIQLRDQASAALDSLGSTLTNVGGLVSGPVVGGLAAAGAAAIDFAGTAQSSINLVQAQLGLTAQEAEALGAVAEQVFANNFGDDIGQATEAVGILQQRLGDLSNEGPTALQGATEAAFALRDAFGVEVADSASAAQTLMEEFGLTSQQAFDMLASGYQKGLDRSGDFLDTITEYSTQFKESGATADQFFSVLETGLQGGALGTDKIADAFKESRIRIMEMSEEVVDSFNSIGSSIGQSMGVDVFSTPEAQLAALQAKAAELGIEVGPNLERSVQQGTIGFDKAFSSLVLGALQQGKISVADVQQIAIEGLGQMENAVWQNTTGVALFGTQWEDLGDQIILGVNAGATSLASMEGAVASLNVQYNSLGAVGETMWRQLLITIAPVGDALLALANAALPLILALFAQLKGTLEQVVPSILGFVTWFQSVLPAAQPLLDLLHANLIPILLALAALIVGPIIASLAGMVGAFLSLAAPIAAAVAVVAALYAAYQSNFLGIQDLVNTVLAGIVALVQTGLAQVQQFWQANGAQIVADATAAWSQIQAILSGAVGIITTIVGGLVALVSNLLRNHGTEIQTILGAAWTAMSAVVRAALALIQGIVTATLQILQGDFRGAWTTIQNTVTTVLNAIGDYIRAQMTIAQTVIGSILQAIAGTFASVWNTIQNTVSSILNSMAAGIVAWLNSTAAAIFANLNQVSQTFTTIWTNIQNSVNTIATALSNALNALFNALLAFLTTNLNTTLQTATSIWTNIQNTVNTIATALSNALNSLFTALLTFLTGNLNSTLQTATTTWTSIQTSVTSIVTALQATLTTIFTAIQNTIATMLASLAATFATQWAAIQHTVSTATNVVKSTIDSALQAAKGIVESTLSAIAGLFTSKFDAAKQAVTTKLNEAKSAAENAINGIKGSIESALSAIVTAFQSKFTEAKNAVQTKLNEAKQVVSGLADDFVSAAKTIGDGIISGIKTGISSGASAIADAARKAARDALDAAKRALGISSPSTVARTEVGRPIPQGAALGIEDETPRLTAAAATMALKAATSATRAVDSLVPLLVDTGATISTGVSTGIRTSYPVVADAVTGLIDRTNRQTAAGAETLVAAATALGTALTKGAGDAISSGSETVRRGIDQLRETMHTKLGATQPLVDQAAQMGDSVANGLGNGLANGRETVQRGIDQMLEQAAQAIDHGAEKMSPRARPVGEGITHGVATGVKENAARITTAVDEAAADAVGRAQRAIDTLLNRTKGGQGTTPRSANSPLTDPIIGPITNAADTQLPAAVKALEDKLATLRTSLERMANDFTDRGKAIGRGIIDGIKRGVEQSVDLLKQPIISVINQALDSGIAAIQRRYAINSPSSVTNREVGRPIGQGVAGGVNDSAPLVEQAVTVLGDVAQDALMSIHSLVTPRFSSQGAAFVDAMGRGVQDREVLLGDTIAATTANAIATSEETLPEMVERVRGVGGQLSNAMGTGIADGQAQMVRGIDQMLDSAATALEQSVERLDPQSRPVGQGIAHGIASGITENAAQIAQAVSTAASGAVSAAQEAVRRIVASGRGNQGDGSGGESNGPLPDQVLTPITDAASSQLPAAVKALEDKLATLRTSLERMANDFTDRGKAIGRGIIDGIKRGVEQSVDVLKRPIIAAIDQALDAALARIPVAVQAAVQAANASVQTTLDAVVAPPLQPGGQSGGVRENGGTTVNIDLTAHYDYQEERSVRDDLTAIALLLGS